MIVYGAGLSDGNRHLHEDLPTLIVGKGGGAIKTGRRVVYRSETPMCNLFLTMMDRMGVHVEHFGDSTGRIQGLDLARPSQVAQAKPDAGPLAHFHPHRRRRHTIGRDHQVRSIATSRRHRKFTWYTPTKPGANPQTALRK